jgi:hypothetical protein
MGQPLDPKEQASALICLSAGLSLGEDHDERWLKHTVRVLDTKPLDLAVGSAARHDEGRAVADRLACSRAAKRRSIVRTFMAVCSPERPGERRCRAARGPSGSWRTQASRVDQLTGGSGADKFAYENGDVGDINPDTFDPNVDRILDFVRGSDKVDL